MTYWLTSTSKLVQFHQQQAERLPFRLSLLMFALWLC